MTHGRHPIRSKKSTPKKALKNYTSLCGSGLLFGLMLGTSAFANPTDGVVVGGSATIVNTPSELQIHQASDRAIINWGSFDINAGETTHFYQPGAGSLAVNRVTTSNQISQINGNLIANGRVVIINPNGVLIGAGGNVNTAGFIATSADLGDQAAMNERVLNFDKAGKANAAVENRGHITVGQEGLAALVAPTVRNSGVIQGNLSKVQLAAADKFGVDFYGDGLISFAVDAPASGNRTISAENTGSLIADGGSVLMTAAAASDVISSSINTTGQIRAQGLVNRNGEITLTGTDADVHVAGTVDASGVNGGTIKIGGDQGGKGTLAKAANVTVDAGALVTADGGNTAEGTGNGGTIITWANRENRFNGDFKARGGANGGDGGFIELSAAKDIYLGGSADASAPKGSAGTFLIDPVTLNIKNGAGATTANTIFENTIQAGSVGGTSYVLTATDLVTLEDLADNNLQGGSGSISLTATGTTGRVEFLDKNDKISTSTGNIVVTAKSGGIDIGSLETGAGGGTSGNITLTTTNGGSISTRNLTAFRNQGGDLRLNVNSNNALTINGDVSVVDLDILSATIPGNARADLTAVNNISVTGGVTVQGQDYDQPYNNAKAELYMTSTAGNIAVGGNVALSSDAQKTTLGGANISADTIAKIFATNGSVTLGGGINATSYASYAPPGGASLEDLNKTTHANTRVEVKSKNNLSIGNSVLGQANAVADQQDRSTTYVSIISTDGDVTLGGNDPKSVADASLVQQHYIGNVIDSQQTTESGATLDTARLIVSGVTNLTVTADAKGKIYGDADPALTYTYSALKAGDTAASVFSGSLTRAPGENVGTYLISKGTLTAVSNGYSNYRINYVPANFTISPATLSIIAAAKSKTYGNADPALTYTASGFKNGDTAAIITGALNRNPGENVGAYAINKNTLSAGSNYTISYTGANLTISPATLSIVAAAKSKTYGDADPALTYTASGFKNGDTSAIITGALNRNAGENVGAYAINKNTLSAGSNYTISYTGANLTISPATLSIIAAAKSKTYGDADPALTYAASGFKNGDTAAIITGALNRNAGENVGSYAINKNTLAAGSNYTISYTGANLTINKANLVVNANAGQSKIYGNADPTLTYTASGFKNGDTAAVLTGAQARAAGENVGNYGINQGSLAASNYNITYTGSTFVISPATLSIIAQAKSKTYGDLDPALTYTVSGLKNGDTSAIITGALNRNPGENVGSYAINKNTLAAGSNYTISYTSANLTINPATLGLSVIADAKSKIYGDADPALTYTATGFKNGDTASIITGALVRTAGENVGVYTINKGTLAAANYTINYTPANFTISPATLSIIAAAKSKTYGDADPALTYAASGFKNGDTAAIITGALNRNAGENVGSYAINKNTLAAGSNYTISYTGANLTINKANLVVNANAGQGKTYGNADPALTYTASGFKNGDTAAVLTGAQARAAGQNVGNYAINQGSLAASNYNITYTGSTFVISPATLSIIADAKSKAFGDVDPALTYTVSGLKNGDTAAVITGALNRNPGESVGSYAINKNTLAAGSNYTITYTGANLTISQAVLNIIAQAKSKIYGDADPALTYTATGFKNGDTAATVLSGSLSRAAGQNVGSYAITQGSLVASNYAINYTGANLTITPATLSIIAAAKSKTYGDADPALTYTASGFKNGETSAIITGSLNRNVGENVGVYAINKNTLSAGSNYTIAYTGANLTINKALLNIAAQAKSKTYGDADPALTYTASGFKNGDTAAIITGALNRNAGENVGSYTINKNTLAAGGNYDVNYTSANLTINKALLNVNANSGQGKTYGDADPTLTFTTIGLKNGDTAGSALTGALARNPGQNVGAYAITQGSLDASNYTITYTGSTFAISPATLSIIADAKSKTYGSGDPSLTYAASGFKNGDTAAIITGGLNRDAGENVGAYGINKNTLAAGSNYTIAYTGANLTINPYSLTVAADAQTKVAGNPDPALTYTHGALQNGDTDAVFTGALERVPGETVAGSPYAIGQGTLSAGSNYTISYTGNVLTIGAAPITTTTLPGIVLDSIERPIISVADQAIIQNLSFEQFDVNGINTNVSIQGNLPGGTNPAALNAIAPAAGGGSSPQDLAKIEPAAGGNTPGQGSGSGAANADIQCGNDFLADKPCQAPGNASAI